MAAYAALNSVMYILQQIQHHPRPPITIEKQHMDSLCEIISFLQDFLENYSQLRDIGDGKKALEGQIADAAYAAEDVIEAHIVNQIHSGDQERSSNSLFCQDLQKVIEDMYLIKKEVIEIQEKMVGINDFQPPRPIISVSANTSGSSAVPVTPPKRKNTNSTMVGFDGVLKEIMDMLTGYPPKLQVLPIVGMGGIGKTTLARNVYDHRSTMHHFDIRIWVNISQEYRLRDIFLKAISCLPNDEFNGSEDELGEKLYKSLYDRRYLIILDDMWSIEAWEKLMLFFPDDKNGSRIMITTRESNVSNHFGSCGFKMNFLDEDKSWDLFCKIVFPQDQCCPLELEQIGMRIARDCKGLPLSIVVIGGILANSDKTRQHWEYLAKNLNSIVNLDDNEHCLNILYLSYNHLPVHLKPCFLYMGVYPEDDRIYVPYLIQLWVNEGFLKPIKDKTLEVVAQEYLKDLIDRNLILVHKLGSIGKVKYCKMHDLLRDLCLREGEKDKFVWIRTVDNLENLQGILSQRRVSIHESASQKMRFVEQSILEDLPSSLAKQFGLEDLPSKSLARSLTRRLNCREILAPHDIRLVRVFNKVDTYALKYLWEDICKLVNLRSLAVTVDWKSNLVVPSTIHQLWNLQTLIIETYTASTHTAEVPPEIWGMSQLRHLEIQELSLPDPPNVPLIYEGDHDLRNLHTLKRVKDLKLTEEVIKRIPNIKKLEVSYYDLCTERWHNYCLSNLGLLNKLESLYIQWTLDFEQNWQTELVQNLAFPHSLKRLTLCGTSLHWEDMRMIGSLPHLQVLKLLPNSFRGPKWNPVDGEFLCLKFLQIRGCDDLVHWNANSNHFPCLEKLVFENLCKLKEIPLDIGQIPTLGSVQLIDCIDSVNLSAQNLLDQQVALGNDDLQLRVVNTELERIKFQLKQARLAYMAAIDFIRARRVANQQQASD